MVYVCLHIFADMLCVSVCDFKYAKTYDTKIEWI